MNSGSNRGTIADGEFTVVLKKKSGATVSSIPIAVNHGNTAVPNGGANGTFLDEAQDQVITFYLSSNLQEIQQPTIDKPHTRASIHLTSSIVQPAGLDTTISVGQTLTVRATASNGVGGTLKFAWDWSATGGGQETFDTEFSTATEATSPPFNTPGDYLIRVVARDGTDDLSGPPFGGHYAVATVKTVHVVNPDDAEARGNLFFPSMTVGQIQSTGVVMKNTGTTTWSSAANYHLDLHRDAVWSPLSVPLSASVSPGSEHSFTFDLQAPSFTGTFACFYRMNHSGFFGQENGTYIDVTSWGGFSSSGLQTESNRLGVDPEMAWTSQARSVGPLPLVLNPDDLRSTGAAAVKYTYAHARTRALDVVLRFTYDPTVLIPARMRPGAGGAGLTRTAGLRRDGEYWVRLVGSVPAGEGLITDFPFQLRPDASIPESFGTITLYYPGEKR